MFDNIIDDRGVGGTGCFEVRNGTERCLHHQCTLQTAMVTMVLSSNGYQDYLMFSNHFQGAVMCVKKLTNAHTEVNILQSLHCYC